MVDVRLLPTEDMGEVTRYLHRSNQKPRYYTAQITDASHPVNKKRVNGGVIINETTGRELIASGNNPTDPWVDGANTTIHTPV